MAHGNEATRAKLDAGEGPDVIVQCAFIACCASYIIEVILRDDRLSH